MKPHPYADILPLLEGEAFDSFVADIKTNGLLEPITIHEGMILDGRNRWNACKAAGVEPQFLEFDGDDPLAFVLSLNVHRRHLSESQRGMVAARLANLNHGGDRQAANLPLGVSQTQAGAMLNVSERTVRSAVAVRDHALPELAQAVDRGAIRVSVAGGLATASEAIQRQAVAEPGRAHTLVKQAARVGHESELGAKQLALPAKRFGVILADPAWRFEPYSRVTGMDRDPSNHYPVMSVADIKALDVAGIAASDSVLFLWATAPMLPEALAVMAGWGFGYRTNFVWAKDRAGTGYWARNNTSISSSASRATSRRQRWARNGRA
jgi:MT-A70/ParB-like nuclease domain